MRLGDLIFGWIFTVLGVCGLVAVAFYGAYWHWLTVAMCGLMAWCCFYTAHKEGSKNPPTESAGTVITFKTLKQWNK